MLTWAGAAQDDRATYIYVDLGELDSAAMPAVGQSVTLRVRRGQGCICLLWKGVATVTEMKLILVAGSRHY